MLFESWSDMGGFAAFVAAIAMVALFLDSSKEQQPLRKFIATIAPFVVLVGGVAWMGVLWFLMKPWYHYALPLLPSLFCLYAIVKRFKAKE